MPSNTFTRRAALLLATAALPLAPRPAPAKNWIAGSGNWHNAANWSPAAFPAAGEAVNIVFTDNVARTVTYDTTAPALGLLDIDLSGAGSNVASLVMPTGNNLTVNGLILGGFNPILNSPTNGRGLLNQSFATTTINSGYDLILGYGAGSTGFYTLSGGSVIANQGEFIGYAGNGSFTQSAGTNNLATNSGYLDIGSAAGSTGTYSLSGTATLAVNSNEYLGDNGSGTFIQSGGTHNVSAAGLLYLGNNTGGAGGYYNLSAGTLSTNAERIGFHSPGTFVQTGGTHTSTNSQLGAFPGSTGTYSLSGTGSFSATNQYVGSGGSGTFNQSGGTNAASNLYLAYSSNSTGTYNLSGGSLNVSSSLIIGGNLGQGPAGTATFNISGSSVLTTPSLQLAFTGPTNTLNFSGGTINTASLILDHPDRFFWTAGTLNLTAGVTWDSSLAGSDTSHALGPNLVLNPGRTLVVTGNESFTGGAFSVTLNAGSAHTVTGSLTLGPSGTITQTDTSSLYVAGGITQSGGAVNGYLQNQTSFTYQSGPFNGRLINQGSLSFGPSFTTGDGVRNESSITLTTGQTLTANGQGLANVGSLTLSGGTLLSPFATNSATLLVTAPSTISSATNFTNDSTGLLLVDRNVRATLNGPLFNSGEIQLGGAASTLTGTGTLSNAGLLRGDGVISKPTANYPTGEIRAESNARIKLANLPADNAGAINLQSGTAEFSLPLTNSPTGHIQGRGTLKSPSLTNNGQIAFSGGFTDVFGPVSNHALLIVTGGSTSTFYDPVANSPGSEFRVSAGSVAVFLAPVTGTGSFTGTGSKYFESGASSPSFLATSGATTVLPAASLTTSYLHESSLTAAGPVTLTPNSPASTLGSLTITTGSLDLTNNDLTITAIPLTTLRTYLLTQQLFSTTANADPEHRLALGYSDAAPTLITLTYYGDANLDGKINADDYALIDRGYAKHLTSWQQGDFNYDGTINNQDYLLIDRVFTQQGGSLSPTFLAQRESQFGPTYVSQLLASLPEPASLPVVAFLATLPTRRRRRPTGPDAAHQPPAVPPRSPRD